MGRSMMCKVLLPVGSTGLRIVDGGSCFEGPFESDALRSVSDSRILGKRSLLL